MTVSEAEHMRKSADKGRSASFCIPGQLHLPISSAHSSNDVCREQGDTPTISFMETVDVTPSHRNKLQPTAAARRSQSCKVQGSKPPRVKKGDHCPGSGMGLDRYSRNESQNVSEVSIEPGNDETGASYNPFLKKVGSMGRLSTLSPQDDMENSPTLRRSASARRPRPPNYPNDSPTALRAGGRATSSMKNRSNSRKGASGATNAKRIAAGYLDVRPTGSAETLDPDAYLLRNFSTTTKGIINRGDSFRRRRSRSNSVQPTENAPGSPLVTGSHGENSPMPTSPEHVATQEEISTCSDDEKYKVVIIGNPGVGKTALLNQFQTSECINAYDCAPGEEKDQPISIVLNSIESEISFINTTTAKELQDEIQKQPPPHGWLVVYSITDKASFQKASEELNKLQSFGLLKGHATVLVGNKCELVRSRAVPTEEAKDLACSYGCKFMEISVGMNHKCDDLLVGILHQLRLKEEAGGIEEKPEKEEKTPWTRNRSLMRASMKAKRFVNKIIGKSDCKQKVCDDFLN